MKLNKTFMYQLDIGHLSCPDLNKKMSMKQPI